MDYTQQKQMSFEYEYPRPALTVDCIVFGLDNDELKVMLIQRDLEPFEGCWALPGGFVHVDETLEEAAYRELSEETGITNVFLEQLYTFGSVDRDPRERIVSVAYYALVNLEGHEIKASTDARNAAWFSISDIPPLAFDHDKIYEMALARLKGKIRYQPIGFELLPRKFTLSQLQRVYELILEEKLDKRNFRKKILKMDILKELDEIQQDVSHRAARLYRFNECKYNQMVKKGFNFEI
jgi:8-oxo-dGTP diphosphatase